MKLIYKLIGTIILFSISCIACHKPGLIGPYLYTDKSSIKVLASEGRDSIEILSNTNWSIVDTASWINISDSSGIGNKKLQLRYSANTRNTERSAILYFKGKGTKTLTVNFTQGPNAYLNSDSNKLKFRGWMNSKDSFNVLSNARWEITGPSWLTITPSSGSGSQKVYIYTNKNNNNGNAQTDVLTLHSINFPQTVYIGVVQESLKSMSWSKLIGANGDDQFNSVCATSDGGGIAAGYTNSIGGEDINSSGGYDILVVKFDPNGERQWSKTFGGEGDDMASSVISIPDGYIITGTTNSHFKNDLQPTHGGKDMLIMKLGFDGSIIWTRTIGGVLEDEATSVVSSPDGYIVTGSSFSNKDGDIPYTKGSADIVVLKLSIDGKLKWIRTYGGSGTDLANSITSVPGGYVIAGCSSSNNSYEIPFTKGGFDILIMKIDINGGLQWLKTYGGSADEKANAIVNAGDGFVITGNTTSNNSYDIPSTYGFNDIVAMKFDYDGNQRWTKIFGSSNNEFGNTIAGFSDGFIIAGKTDSGGNGNIPSSNGNGDLIVIKVDRNGNKISAITYGGNGGDGANSIAVFGDGVVFAGFSDSNDSGNIPTGHGGYDAWLFKILL